MCVCVCISIEEAYNEADGEDEEGEDLYDGQADHVRGRAVVASAALPQIYLPLLQNCRRSRRREREGDKNRI